MNEGLVEITELASFCKDGTQDKVSEATELILSGTYNVFDGELKTNTGEILVIAIIGIVGAGLISSTISRVLKSEITSLEYLAMGNLNVQIDKKNLHRKDEIGDLSRAIDTLKTDLRSVIGGISESTNLLISSSDSLEQTSHQTFENMDYVMQSVDTITTSAIS